MNNHPVIGIQLIWVLHTSKDIGDMLSSAYAREKANNRKALLIIYVQYVSSLDKVYHYVAAIQLMAVVNLIMHLLQLHTDDYVSDLVWKYCTRQ